jgi:hypothetical protein
VKVSGEAEITVTAVAEKGGVDRVKLVLRA